MQILENQTETVEEILQLVSFKLGEEEFAVDILKVQEINKTLQITKVPNTPKSFEGIVNLRGKVIPVVDLRQKMGMPHKEEDQNTRIIVVELVERTIGFIVDQVKEVLRIPKSITEPPPRMVFNTNTNMFTSVAKLENRLIILLDLEQLFSENEKKELNLI